MLNSPSAINETLHYVYPLHSKLGKFKTKQYLGKLK